MNTTPDFSEKPIAGSTVHSIHVVTYMYLTGESPQVLITTRLKILEDSLRTRPTRLFPCAR